VEKNSTEKRLHVLDGIRGLAILLVVLNHVKTTYIVPLIPQSFSLVHQTLFTSGVFAVSLLFLLSGFFMAYIYPNPTSKLNFLQKRYTRIFPLFLTMCSVMFFATMFPNMWYATILFLFLLAVLVHLIWVYGIKRLHATKISRVLFVSFLLLQVCLCLFYGFWIMRHPLVYFNQVLPTPMRDATIFLVNATLTFPLGQFIPMLDGVYWSLAAEVLFYVLYPFFCAPVIHYFAPKNRVIKIILILSLLPLFIGVDVLAHHLFVLSTLQFCHFYYFISGMTLGFLYKNNLLKVTALHNACNGIFSKSSVLLFFIALVFGQLLFNTLPSNMFPWIRSIWAIPFAYLVALALDNKSSLSRFLSSKFFIFLGTISYSIYLTHTLVIHIMEDNFHPTNTLLNICIIIAIFLITIAVSYALYILLEKPYFMRTAVQKKPEVVQNNVSYARFTVPLLIMAALYLLGVFAAFQSKYNFFSSQYQHASSIFVSPTPNSNHFISMSQHPIVTMEIKAPEDNFGIIVMHVVHKTVGETGTQDLIFQIKERGAAVWHASVKYHLSEIADSHSHELSFPSIPDSKGKVYVVQLSLSNPKRAEYLDIDTSDNVVRSVYTVNKYI
jgi:peptidoglycan/LPS O-acetylase OafA/YrhL